MLSKRGKRADSETQTIHVTHLDYLVPLRSKLKINILLSLQKGEKKLAELKNEIGNRETTILHALKTLETLKLTTKSAGAYLLTPLGIIEAQICSEYLSAMDAIKKFKNFWLRHDVTGIPLHLLSKIGALKDSTLIETDTLELGKVYKNFQEILLTSKKVTGISPIFHPDYVPIVEHLLRQGNEVELILTSAVLDKTLALAKVDLLKKDCEEERLKIFLREDLKVALTVTEKNFSLGLFNLNGEYDDKMDLVSLSPETIEWGKELFQDYLKGSRRIGVDSLS